MFTIEGTNEKKEAVLIKVCTTLEDAQSWKTEFVMRKNYGDPELKGITDFSIKVPEEYYL